ncbi:hypothetical protein LCI18_008130 [Fusarium solani-melongenae]|uniref:Uncharacterized protein n=1 Tax=Fusarium solani subsp. cucurbitae TaxID=2747967 RepID=A0ACD3Z7V2_FUSSC|nr:hypothetical protein LCI18_008130 [Fusarium solani-melongenae]
MHYECFSAEVLECTTAATTAISTFKAKTVPPAPEPDHDPVTWPDIEWIPSYETYRQGVEILAATADERPKSLPEGWPNEVNHPRAWAGSDFKSADDYVFKFTSEDIAEIEKALATFKVLLEEGRQSPDPDAVNRDTFPLPNLGPKLKEVSATVHDGTGFSILRGLDPSKYSTLYNVLVYLGVTTYIADLRGCQDYDGRMLVMPFHNDCCNILSLYAYDVSAEGGESLLASGAKIYNEIAATRPDVIRLLADDNWVFGEFHNGDYHKRPLLHQFSHGPGFVYSRRPLTGAWFSPHYPGVPAMTEEYAEALDMVHFTAEKHALEVRLQRSSKWRVVSY